jgi:GTP-binding protein
VYYKYQPKTIDVIVTKINDSLYSVSGSDIEKIYNRTNFLTDEATTRFLRQLRQIGVYELLREKGAKNGDTIRIFDDEFEYHD